MRTVGRVDRVDTYENENQVYVKVIDYKSGHTKFQLLQLYYGRQLQLVVYLNAAMEKVKQEHPGKEVLPAGIFYYHLDDPMVETEEALSEQEILTEVLKQLRLNGLVSLEPEAYTHMDRELPEKRTSDVIPISLNQDLSVSRRAPRRRPTENFEKLSAYVQEQIRQAADAILAGEIDVNPYRLGDQTGCDYCEYRSVCGFDGRMPGYGYRAEEKLKDEEIWRRSANRRGRSRKSAMPERQRRICCVSRETAEDWQEYGRWNRRSWEKSRTEKLRRMDGRKTLLRSERKQNRQPELCAGRRNRGRSLTCGDAACWSQRRQAPEKQPCWWSASSPW